MTAAALPRVFLQAGRDRRIGDGHPWAYSNEIRMDAEAKALPAGTLATLHRVDGKPLGIGTFNPHTLIAFRLFARDARTAIDEHFFAARLERARTLRDRLFDTPYYRLIHAEADGLPGLVCDRFGAAFVVQANTAGMDALTPPLLAALDRVFQPARVVLRNDSAARDTEGLAAAIEVARGGGDAVAEVHEGGLRYFADLEHGQKTGWFYDQRDSRAFVAPLASGGSLLDVYCHTGGFAVAAAAAGAARVQGVDSSEPALALARRAAEANGVAARTEFCKADVFDALERLGQQGERFRVVVADPPAFVRSRKDLAAGLRGYRKLARLAAALVEPGGFLYIASCSHNVEPQALLDETVHGIGLARTARILREARASADHPVHPHLPETAYLKSFVLQVE